MSLQEKSITYVINRVLYSLAERRSPAILQAELLTRAHNLKAALSLIETDRANGIGMCEHQWSHLVGRQPVGQVTHVLACARWSQQQSGRMLRTTVADAPTQVESTQQRHANRTTFASPQNQTVHEANCKIHYRALKVRVILKALSIPLGMLYYRRRRAENSIPAVFWSHYAPAAGPRCLHDRSHCFLHPYHCFLHPYHEHPRR